MVDFSGYLKRFGIRLFDLSSLSKLCKNCFSLIFLRIVSIPISNIYFTTEEKDSGIIRKIICRRHLQ